MGGGLVAIQIERAIAAGLADIETGRETERSEITASCRSAPLSVIAYYVNSKEAIPILAMSGMHHGHKTADLATWSQHFYVLRKDMAFILFVVDGRMDNNQQIAKSARH